MTQKMGLMVSKSRIRNKNKAMRLCGYAIVVVNQKQFDAITAAMNRAFKRYLELCKRMQAALLAVTKEVQP